VGFRDGGFVDQTPYEDPTWPIAHRVGLRSSVGRGSGRRLTLALLAYCNSADGLESLISTDGGAQQSRVVGGSQQIAVAMARNWVTSSSWANQYGASPTATSSS